jgi:hypothetical protein
MKPLKLESTPMGQQVKDLVANPWVPSVEDGQCHQEQKDGSWISCACRPSEPCNFDGGGKL